MPIAEVIPRKVVDEFHRLREFIFFSNVVNFDERLVESGEDPLVDVIE
jgi:hypothetical protein